jgi:sugar O-acyltransferase (sialic acid O-acetyltransferase NeuD family)
MKLVIYGAGGHGCGLLRLSKRINNSDNRWDEILFADDVIFEKFVMEHRVFPFAEISKFFTADEVEFVIGIGEPTHRRMLAERIKKVGYDFTDPIVYDKENLEYSTFGKGVVAGVNSNVGINATIAENVYIGNNASIGHDSIIGTLSFICRGVAVGGCSIIGEGVFIGINATICDHIKIGNNAVVSAGACVIKDVPEGMIAMGNPARIIPSYEGQKLF